MAANTNLKTSISFGAKIDSSFTGATGSLNKALKGIGTETARNTALQTTWGRQLGRSLGSATGETEKLKRAQDSLRESMRAAALAGKDTGRLEKRYAAISAELEKATRRQHRLTEAMRREVQIAERAERAAQRRAAIGNGLRAGGRVAWRTGTGMGRGLMSVGKWASAGLLAGATGAVASPIMLNSETAEKAGLARSYGLNIGKYMTGGLLAKQAGLNDENFGDLAEELVNKVWEEGNEKTLNPLLKQIGLTKGVTQKLGRRKAFDTVMQRLSTMKDKEQAASLADQLMGGESNKLMTWLTSTGQSYEQAMKNAQRFNLLTQEGADGAVKANAATDRLWTVAVTGMQDTVGKITGVLAPTVDGAALELADWIKGIQPKLTREIMEWMKPDGEGRNGPQRLWDGMVKFGHGVETVADVVMAVANRLKWLLPDERKDQRNVLSSLARTGSVDIARNTAQRNGQAAWFEEQLKANPALPAEVKKAFTDSRGFLFDDDKAFEQSLQAILDRKTSGRSSTTSLADRALPAVPFRIQPQQTNHNSVSITVHAAPGQSPESVGQSVYDEFRKSLPGGGESLSGNFAFDMPSF